MKKFIPTIYAASTALIWALVGTLPTATIAAGQDAQAVKKKTQMNIAVSPYKKRPEENAATAADGKVIFGNACVYCHGLNGEGDGPVAFYLARNTAPRPRDLTSGIFKFRSTASGELPLDEDIYRTITRGVVGYMPSFVGLSSADRWKLVYYIKSLVPDFKEVEDPEIINMVGNPAPSNAASIHRGYEVFQEFKCWECHGDGGQGDGKKAPTLKDDWGFPLPPRDLTRLRSFKNGGEPADLYRTIMTGFDGGAMPSYADFFEGYEADVWHLVNYINSLSE